MQSLDEKGNVVQLVPVDTSKPSALQDLFNKIATAEQKGAVTHVIAKLATKDDVITVNGLRYRVVFADFVKGKHTVKMVCMDRPKEK